MKSLSPAWLGRIATDLVRLGPARRTRNLYLDLLEQTLTGAILGDPGIHPTLTPGAHDGYDPTMRQLGLDWPVQAQTMVGVHRLKNLRSCISTILRDGVAGDLIETGVWRGGACIYMRANLAVRGVSDRRVWVADSFEGLPPPDLENFPVDEHDKLHSVKLLAVSLEEVRENFRKYGMLDDQVVFLKGFFKDTLKTAPIRRLALLRLDGDMYESTMQALDALYDKVSPGGFVIVDDYSLANCRQAVTEYRERHGIDEPIVDIDGNATFWRKRR